MYLAVALAKLDDIDNACAAYERAIQMDDDLMFRLNYGESALTSEHSCLLVMHFCVAQNQCMPKVVLADVQPLLSATLAIRKQLEYSLTRLRQCMRL